jgi:hypothetical protein
MGSVLQVARREYCTTSGKFACCRGLLLYSNTLALPIFYRAGLGFPSVLDEQTLHHHGERTSRRLSKPEPANQFAQKTVGGIEHYHYFSCFATDVGACRLRAD